MTRWLSFQTKCLEVRQKTPEERPWEFRCLNYEDGNSNSSTTKTAELFLRKRIYPQMSSADTFNSSTGCRNSKQITSHLSEMGKQFIVMKLRFLMSTMHLSIFPIRFDPWFPRIVSIRFDSISKSGSSIRFDSRVQIESRAPRSNRIESNRIVDITAANTSRAIWVRWGNIL